VHGEQTLTIHKPLPVEGDLIGTPKLVRVLDKGVVDGRNRGAVAVTERKVYDKKTGDHICTLEQTSFWRGDGGFGGQSGPSREPHVLPQTAPQFTCDLHTLPQAALIYRLSGDYNPLHSEPAHAQKVGFPRPILHGLGTFGVAGHALLKTLCGYDPSGFKSMEARFSSPVYPGETLRTEMWKEGNVVSFRCTVPARENVVVLNNGRAEIV
jgi:acyl dehydratase